MTSTTRALAFPLAGLVAVLILGTAFQVSMMLLGGEVSKSSIHLYDWSYTLLVVLGVELDRRAKGVSAPFEYPAFMFFLWTVLLPIYLFQTRRWRGLAIAAAIVALLYLPYGVAYAIWLTIV